MGQRAKLLTQARQNIALIPWEVDQIERYVGLADDLQGVDTVLCRELLQQAVGDIVKSSEDLGQQRRRLIDIAYRVNEDFAKKLIDLFDSDEAKRSAQCQVRMLDIRKGIADNERSGATAW